MKYKHLAIFSDCLHYADPVGNVVTEIHIFRRQMQALASQFEKVTIYCPFGFFSDSLVVSKYEESNILFYRLPVAGGRSIKGKLSLLKAMPLWFRAFNHANKNADIIYQRFPNNLNLPGFFFFYFSKARVFGTYTGTWNNYRHEPLTYRFQKYLLRHFFRGPVGIYSYQENLKSKNVFSSFSPSYSEIEWYSESEYVIEKVKKIESGRLTNPVFITVGALVASKNQLFILRVFHELNKIRFPFQLYIVGDGPLAVTYRDFIASNNLEQKVFLTGNMTSEALHLLYRKADFVVQASLVEGYGKVTVEAFFHGVIPLLHSVNMAGYLLNHGERGFLFEASDLKNLINLIISLPDQTKLMVEMILSGRTFSKDLVLEKWVRDYCSRIYM